MPGRVMKWQRVCKAAVDDGVYAVSLTRLGEERGSAGRADAQKPLALTLSVHAGVPLPVADELMKRVQHVRAQKIIEGVSLDDAVAVKT